MNNFAFNNMIEFSSEELLKINGGSRLGAAGNILMGAGTAVFGVGINIASTGVGAAPGAGTCVAGGILFGAGAALSFLDS